MAASVLVSGASGFVGRAVVEALLARGYRVWAGSRTGKDVGAATGLKLDVTDFGSVLRAYGTAQPEIVVHLVGIIQEEGDQTFERVHLEGTRHMLRAAPPSTRYLHMSALGADPDSASRYSATKGEAEALVRQSGLAWTIFRPSLIFGKGDDFFGRVLKELVSAAPIVPQIGDGSFLFRPVSIGDVAQAFAQAPSLPDTVDQSYDLTGSQEFTFRQLLELELSALGKHKPIIPVPLPLMNLAVPLMQILPKPPITRDQYAMLKEGNTAPNDAARAAFDLPMLRLEDKLPEIVRGK